MFTKIKKVESDKSNIERYQLAKDKSMQELILRSASPDRNVAFAAQREIAKAVEGPLREAVLDGDVLGNIFAPLPMPPGTAPEFPLDILTPGMEKEFVAYTIPYHGYIPQRTLEGDFVMVQTYEIGSSIDWPLRLAQRARWDIVRRAVEIFEASFVTKLNSDGWHTILASGKSRGMVVYDPAAGAGRLSLRLLTLLQQAMTRYGGGNLTSLRRGSLTDLYMSIELFQDMRSWTIADIDEVTRSRMFQSPDGVVNEIYGVRLHPMFELGAGQKFQDCYINELADTLNAGDTELPVGLDLSNRENTFVMPVVNDLEVFEDDNLHRERRAGIYGWMETGFAVLDNRRVILGSA